MSTQPIPTAAAMRAAIKILDGMLSPLSLISPEIASIIDRETALPELIAVCKEVLRVCNALADTERDATGGRLVQFARGGVGDHARQTLIAVLAKAEGGAK